MFFFQTIQSIGALSYYFKYIVGDEGAAGILSIMSFVLLPTMFLFPVLMKKLSASQIIALGAVFSCLGYVVNYFAGASMTPILKSDSMELGTGNMPLDVLMEQAKEAGCEAVILESHRNWIGQSPVKSLQLSARYLNERV